MTFQNLGGVCSHGIAFTGQPNFFGEVMILVPTGLSSDTLEFLVVTTGRWDLSTVSLDDCKLDV